MNVHVEWNELSIFRFSLLTSTCGAAENLIYHPLWVLKTRDQLDTTPSKNHLKRQLELCKQLYKQQGICHGFYRGFWFGTLTSTPPYLASLLLYLKLKHDFAGGTTVPTWFAPTLAGWLSEVAVLPLVVPSDIICQRMQLENAVGKTSMQLARQIYSEEGVQGFFRGTGLTAFKFCLGAASFWSFYEHGKSVEDWLLQRNRKDNSIVAAGGQGLTAGAAAGIGSTLVTLPIDVVKTRLQCGVMAAEQALMGPWADKGCNPLMRSLAPILRESQHIYLHEGIRGFFRGYVPRLVSAGPAAGVSSLIYEVLLHCSSLKSCD